MNIFTKREAINGNIKSLLRRGRGYRNLRYLLLNDGNVDSMPEIEANDFSSQTTGSS
jgi:hypothetical protein